MGVSRPLLARAVLGVAVAVCAVSAVLVLAMGSGPRVAPPEPGPGPAAELTGLTTAPPAGERVVVERVVDAVTFDARLPDGGPVIRVRALGVQPPGGCYDAQATAFASRVLDGRAVTLVPVAGPAADRFDRRLAAVALDGGDYAVLAAEAGIARVYAPDAAPTALPAVRAAQDRARLAERGVWGSPCHGAQTAPLARSTPRSPSTASPRGTAGS